jgi:hypothetical protein
MWARIVHTYPDGSTTRLEIGHSGPTYPDAAAECVARVLDMWREVCVEDRPAEGEQ